MTTGRINQVGTYYLYLLCFGRFLWLIYVGVIPIISVPSYYYYWVLFYKQQQKQQQLRCTHSYSSASQMLCQSYSRLVSY